MTNQENKKRNPHAIYFDEPTMTKQEFKDDCDINLIMERALRGQVINNLNERVARWGDVSSIPDYRTSLDMVTRAQGMFMELPPSIRERFANDPAMFLDFVANDQNYDEAVRLGLIPPKAAVAKPEAQNAPEAKADVKS